MLLRIRKREINASSGGRGRRQALVATLAVAVLGVVATLALGRTSGLVAAGYHFLEFYTGVFALVALTGTVVGGLCATNRSVLLVAHRVLLQTAHRLAAAVALACLVVHIVLKVGEDHADVVDAIVPFVSPHRRLFVGFGTLAFAAMVLLAWTGAVRGRFATGRHPGLWRAIHAAAYPSWLLAILHGLGSGRHAAGWVTASYACCVAAVALALVVRIAGSRRGASRTATTTVRRSSEPHPFPPAPPQAPPEPRQGSPEPRQAPPEPRQAPPEPHGALSDLAIGDASDEEFWAYMRSALR